MSERPTYRFRLLTLAVLLTEIVFWSVAVSIWFYLHHNVPEFRFENTTLLYGMFFVPLTGLIYLLAIRWKNKALRRFGDEKLLPALSGGVSSLKSFARFFLFRQALALLVIAAANPQYGKTKKEAIASGIDLMIAIDVSNSMQARDMSGDQDRLRLARLAIEKLIGKLHGDRIGLVVFAGEAYTQLPITSDYSAARLFLSGISTGMVTSQGTAIGRAIETCMEAFGTQEGNHKAIIIISDGENHEDDAVGAAKAAAEKGVIVNTVGMGSPAGAPIPLFENGRRVGVKRDREGNTVITRLNETMLKDIARAGNGSYIKASGTNLGLEQLLKELSKIEKNQYDTDTYTDYEDQFRIFLGVAILLLLLESLILERRSRWIEKFLSWGS